MLLNKRTGRIVSATPAEYHVSANANMPLIDILCHDIPDGHPLGAHGADKIGITGVAAIVNVVFNATGTRIHSLPIALDKVLVG